MIIEEKVRVLTRVLDINDGVEDHAVGIRRKGMIEERALANLAGTTDHHNREGPDKPLQAGSQQALFV